MNKIFLISAFTLIFYLNVSAQLKVYQNGNVNVKSADSTSTVTLSIGSSTYPGSYSVYLSSSNPSTASYNIGVEGRSMPTTAQTTGRAIGVRGVAGNCTSGFNYGVMGVLKGSNNGTAVFGTLGPETGVQLNGKYAGFFHGDVKVSGMNKSKLANSFDNINSFSYALTSALTIINNIQAVRNLGSDIIFAQDSMPVLNPNGRGTSSLETHYAFNPASISQLYPDLVLTDANGNNYVNYTEVIPLLVGAVQELYTLYTQASAANGATFEDDGYGAPSPSRVESPSIVSGCRLYQNTPNPFDANTLIKYSVPSYTKDAYIFIFDMRGSMLRQIRLDTGSDRVVIHANELQPGMYLYSLVVNGSEIDTKRMILSK